MFDRRQLIQNCLAVLATMSLPSASRATLSTAVPKLPPVSLDDDLPPPIADGLTSKRRIKVVGVGGCGGNAIRHMIASGVSGFEYIFANADTDALSRCGAHKTIQVDRKIPSIRTHSDRGCDTAGLTVSAIRAAINGADMLIIIAGMGGDTGTEATPVIARISKEMGLHTAAVVTTPFSWEGPRRMRYAEIGLAKLQSFANALVLLPNEKLLTMLDGDPCLEHAMSFANEMIKEAALNIAGN
ncbi:MAG: hypothetical protein K9K38_19475 [Rhodoferax sp.]|nr:hypothetical protein [Rhodoferax sp.]